MKCPTLKFRFTQITTNLVNFAEAITKIKIWTKKSQQKSNQNQIMNKTEKHWHIVLHYKYNLDIYKKVDITCYLLHE